jgi:MerR family transcriptional regulator/heat shock protein HspR
MRKAAKLYRLEEVLEVTEVSRRTLRTYEEVGLVSPASREGRSPVYAEEMVETVHRIQRLRRDLGVNLAGVQVILEMRSRIEDLQQNLEELVAFVQNDLRGELAQYLRRQEKAVIPKPLTTPQKPPTDE